MAGRKLRLGLMAGACGAVLGLLVPTASAETAGETGTPFELAFWQAVATSNDPVLYAAYLKQYPRGTFAAIAQVKAGGQGPENAPISGPISDPISNLSGPLPAPPVGQAGLVSGLLASSPEAAMALRDVAAAQRTANAAQAAAATAALAAAAQAAPAITAPIAADSPVVTALAAPSSPVAAPAFALASAAPGVMAIPVQDLFGSASAMPLASAALLASLSTDAVASPAPVQLPALPLAPLLAPTAPPTMLASLGAAPAALPTAATLAAAVAAQTTPARLARIEAPLALPAIPARQAPAFRNAASPRFAAAAYAPRARGRRAASAAQFTRAVVSTAAVSVEMPDAARQISPLGLMLGQLVHTQETPGAQYGLQESLTMPMRPRLMAMPEVGLPQSFCSADQRGAFDEGIYRPALAIAEHNADVAGAYVRKLRTLYDNSQLSGDSTAQAAIAAEARDFARTANAASSIHNALVNQFEDIMTTPIHSCGAIQ